MIDLDKIEQQCKGAIENGCGHLPVLGCGNAVKLMEVVSRLRYAEAETGAILSMLRQSEKDAARYRWLDEQNKNVMSKVMVCNGWIDDGDDIEYVSDLASFIDEAMKCK